MAEIAWNNPCPVSQMGEGRIMQEQLSRATHGAVAEVEILEPLATRHTRVGGYPFVYRVGNEILPAFHTHGWISGLASPLP